MPSCTFVDLVRVSPILFFFRIRSNFSILRTLSMTLLVQAGLFWSFLNPPNLDLDCVQDR